jgi:hypothetical protein
MTGKTSGTTTLRAGNGSVVNGAIGGRGPPPGPPKRSNRSRSHAAACRRNSRRAAAIGVAALPKITAAAATATQQHGTAAHLADREMADGRMAARRSRMEPFIRCVSLNVQMTPLDVVRPLSGHGKEVGIARHESKDVTARTRT